MCMSSREVDKDWHGRSIEVYPRSQLGEISTFRSRRNMEGALFSLFSVENDIAVVAAMLGRRPAKSLKGAGTRIGKVVGEF